METKKTRCAWVPEKDALYLAYHDEEWGVPVRDDKVLFEFLVLEAMQAGLSWRTVLHKRKGYRQAFDDFDCEVVAEYGDAKLELLLQNKGIIRNAQKIRAAIHNARIFLQIQKEYGSFSTYLWDFVGGRPKHSAFECMQDLPAETKLSARVSTDLKKHGMRFMGPTSAYAYMQSVGLVNDHETSCFRYEEVKRM